MLPSDPLYRLLNDLAQSSGESKDQRKRGVRSWCATVFEVAGPSLLGLSIPTLWAFMLTSHGWDPFAYAIVFLLTIVWGFISIPTVIFFLRRSRGKPRRAWCWTMLAFNVLPVGVAWICVWIGPAIHQLLVP